MNQAIKFLEEEAAAYREGIRYSRSKQKALKGRIEEEEQHEKESKESLESVEAAIAKLKEVEKATAADE